MNRGDELSRRRSPDSCFFSLVRLGLSPVAASFLFSIFRLTYMSFIIACTSRIKCPIPFTADEKNGTPPCTYDIHVAAVVADMKCACMCDVCMQCMHAIVDRADRCWVWDEERRDCDGWNSKKRDTSTCEFHVPGQGSYCH